MKKSLLALATVGLFAGAASAQVWNEVGDAEAGVPGNQKTAGSGALSAIIGSIDRPNGDHTDTYAIRITDVAQFFATTKIAFGGAVPFDSRLWLWDANGNPLLANDDVDLTGADADSLSSFISDPSTFAANTGEIVAPSAAGISLNAGDIVLLSISSFSQDPEDAGLVDIFDLSDFDALNGPNPASTGVFNAWEDFGDSDAGQYTIALRGAEYVNQIPAPGALALLGLAGLAGLRRRRG